MRLDEIKNHGSEFSSFSSVVASLHIIVAEKYGGIVRSGISLVSISNISLSCLPIESLMVIPPSARCITMFLV